MAVDSAGNLYVADRGNSVIRKIDTNGIITTVAGNGTGGYNGDGGPATGAEFNTPQAVMVDSAGNLYISDGGNNVIRKANVTSAALSFGALSVGQPSAAQSVVVSDVGNAPVTFLSLGFSSNFQLATAGGDCATALPLAPGTNCNL